MSDIQLPAITGSKISHLEVGKVYLLQIDAPDAEIQELVKTLSAAGIFAIVVRTAKHFEVFSSFPVRVDIPVATMPKPQKPKAAKKAKKAAPKKQKLIEG